MPRRFSLRKHRGLTVAAKDATIEEPEDITRDIFSDNEYIAKIRAQSPDDAKYLHPDTPEETLKRGAKYMRNPLAVQTLMQAIRRGEDAYMYFPLGSKEPRIWFHNTRYTVPEFEHRYGVIESDNPRKLPGH